MDGRLNRREAEQYLFKVTGLDIAALGGLAEEKYTKHKLNQLVTDLVKHKESKHEE
ncbi:hypothetical protein [Pediococcus ethanolidurans]|uniref:hypothetical protein n=1 Tax=Pediococcus ethanolidurans TaxID=319653 RepID=UPI000A6E9C6B|nr:hypothetical protein [Pediococcus ethanolidurans]GEN94710.1 hypothetical protein PET01_07600 [Pediococcus ethanolidurans]